MVVTSPPAVLIELPELSLLAFTEGLYCVQGLTREVQILDGATTCIFLEAGVGSVNHASHCLR